MDRPRYSFQVFWSAEDQEFVATCVEIPGLSGLGATEEAALGEVKTAVQVWLDYLVAHGEPLPVPQPFHAASTPADSPA